ncbi:hypothetical protein [Sphingomonas sp. ERG5]|uniref:hypothetical protein n=1 Tax=Sphingomonas sp. ERG5 TaxID=1381597 RepID=UPI00126A19C0|nr:hypothetical protein [Sphingomonas sp. ERG5]
MASRSIFPQLRELLRENAFLRVLRESAGKAAGVLMDPHGSFSNVLREYREMVGADIMVCSIRRAA